MLLFISCSCQMLDSFPWCPILQVNTYVNQGSYLSQGWTSAACIATTFHAEGLEFMPLIAAPKMDIWKLSSSTFFRTSYTTLKSKDSARTKCPRTSRKVFGAFGKSMPISTKRSYNKALIPIPVAVQTFLSSKCPRDFMTSSHKMSSFPVQGKFHIRW